MKTFYIISLKHTQSSDDYITLWRPNDRGYCYSKEEAGEYDSPQKDYHDSEGNMPISTEDADKLFISVNYDGHPKRMIPNCKAIWKQLGVKLYKNSLIKIKL